MSEEVNFEICIRNIGELKMYSINFWHNILDFFGNWFLQSLNLKTNFIEQENVILAFIYHIFSLNHTSQAICRDIKFPKIIQEFLKNSKINFVSWREQRGHLARKKKSEGTKRKNRCDHLWGTKTKVGQYWFLKRAHSFPRAWDFLFSHF